MADESKLDNLFLAMTTGSKIAHDQLFSWFVKKGLSIAKQMAKQNGIYCYNEQEVEDFIVELFMVVIRSFEPGRAKFKTYALYLLKKRLCKTLIESCGKNGEVVASLDATDEEGHSLYDVVESSEYEEMKSDIYRKDQEYIMASGKIRTEMIDERIKRFYDLKEQGYKKRQILKLMKLSEGKYRYMLRVINSIIKGDIKIDLN